MSDDDLDAFELEIAEAIRMEYRREQQRARVPPVELVWFQAQMRAREEAVRKAVRPLIIGQAVGAAAFAGLLAGIVSRMSLPELPHVPLILAGVVLTSWLVLTPLAIYLSVARDR